MSDSDETPVARPRAISAPAVAAPVIKTAEEWALEKGFLPKRFPGTPPHQNGQRVIPGIAPKANPKYIAYSAAKAGRGWIEGVELSEADFDEAMLLIHAPI